MSDGSGFAFGVTGYRPQWLRGRRAIEAAHTPQLRGLVGRELTVSWQMWSSSDDTWFADGPVLLDFAGVQLEVNHQKFDELSITWDSIDPARPIRWPDDQLALSWRSDTSTELGAVRGRTLLAIDLLECTVEDLGLGSLAVGLDFGHRYVYIDNALDENGLILGPPPAASYRRFRVGT